MWGRGEGLGVRVGVKGKIAETTQSFTKMLTLGVKSTLWIMFRPKVSIFVKVWVVSAFLPLTPYGLPLTPHPDPLPLHPQLLPPTPEIVMALLSPILS